MATRQPFMIKNGDRVVFWGDSITDNSLWARTVENYVRSRYPSWDVDFHNLGWGGDTAAIGVQRMERDIKSIKPTLMTIMLGMNDGAYQAFDQAVCDAYVAQLHELIGIARKVSNPRLIFVTPHQYETGVRPGEEGAMLDRVYPDTLRRLSTAVIAMARKRRIPVIDLNRLYELAVGEYKKHHREFGFSADGVHPLADGNALIAWLLLKAMGADGEMVSCVVDMNSATATGSNGAYGKPLRVEKGISFTRTVTAFPFATAEESSLAPGIAAFRGNLNANRLTVTGLSRPYCIIEVEGHPIGIFPKAKLKQGLDLAGLGLPEYEVSAFIAELVREKHDARYRRWRNEQLKNLDRTAPFRAETPVSRYLLRKSNFIARFLSSDPFTDCTYRIRLLESESGSPFPDAPFVIKPPYPTKDEVQIKFVVDTSLWKNIASEKVDYPLALTGTLKIKGAFTQWLPAAMTAEGNGVFSLQANCLRSTVPQTLAFDDDHPVRGAFESQVMEIIKRGLGKTMYGASWGHPAFVPDANKIVPITKLHFLDAVEKGAIKLKG
jgi:lysophospholipase L1-like esterase